VKECETLSARSADQVAEMQKLQAVVGYAFGTCIWSLTIVWKRMCNCVVNISYSFLHSC